MECCKSLEHSVAGSRILFWSIMGCHPWPISGLIGRGVLSHCRGAVRVFCSPSQQGGQYLSNSVWFLFSKKKRDLRFLICLLNIEFLKKKKKFGISRRPIFHGDRYRFGLVAFYDISTLVGYLMPNLFSQIISSISNNSV